MTLRQAYEDAGNDFKAAETLEQQNEIYPNPEDYNLIGVYYHNSGNKDKAIEFLKERLNIIQMLIGQTLIWVILSFIKTHKSLLSILIRHMS